MKLISGCVAGVLALAAGASAAPAPQRTETAVLAGGCYWGMQEVFEHVSGVTGVVAGLAGAGTRPGIAEAVKIAFDPSKISYDQLLQVYFTVAHDPTEVNRQGPDEGTRYRSAIFPQSPQQAAAARAFIARLAASHLYKAPIATRLESGGFAPVEQSQQDFARKHPTFPYIVINDVPKVERLKQRYPGLWKA